MKPKNLGFEEEESTINPPTPVQSQANGNWFPVKGLPSGITGVYGRPLTYREIKKISYANDSTIDEALLSVAQSAIKFPDGKTPDIYDADLRYIFLWLRANTMLDPRFDMLFTCTNPECGKDTSFKLEPSDIESVNLAEGLTPMGEVLDIGGKKITVALPSALRAIEATKITKLYAEEESIELDAYIASFVTVNGLEKNDPLSVFEWIDSLEPLEVVKIHEAVKKYDCGLVDVVVKRCQHCGKDSKVELDMQSVFFFPTV